MKLWLAEYCEDKYDGYMNITIHYSKRGALYSCAKQRRKTIDHKRLSLHKYVNRHKNDKKNMKSMCIEDIWYGVSEIEVED